MLLFIISMMAGFSNVPCGSLTTMGNVNCFSRSPIRASVLKLLPPMSLVSLLGVFHRYSTMSASVVFPLPAFP